MIPNEGIPISTVTGVPGWRHGPDEEQVIITYAQRYVPDGGLIVELGTEYGRGASELAYGCSGKSGVRLVSVDLFPSNHGVVGDLYAAWEHNLRQAEHLFPDVHIGFLRGDTAEVGFSTQHARQQGTLAEGWKDGISLLFIDGGHDTKSVTRDLEAWSPLMTAHGVILIHDYWKSIDSHPLHMEVKKAVDAWHNADLWQRLDLPGSLVAFHRLVAPQHVDDELQARIDDDERHSRIMKAGRAVVDNEKQPFIIDKTAHQFPEELQAHIAQMQDSEYAFTNDSLRKFIDGWDGYFKGESLPHSGDLRHGAMYSDGLEAAHKADNRTMPNFPAVFDDDENPTQPVEVVFDRPSQTRAEHEDYLGESGHTEDTDPFPPDFTIKQIAELRGVSVSTVRNWVRGLEPAGKDGKANTYYLEDMPPS